MRLDAIIIGGGPVGSVLAVGLAQAGLKVAVVDKTAPENVETMPDGRAFSLNLGTKILLARLGLWAGLEPHATPIKTIKISEENEAGTLTFQAYDAEVEALGFMVCATEVRARLSAAARAQCIWFAPDEVVALPRTPWGVTATLASGQILEAPLVIAADGRFSETRARAGLKTYGWPYPQKAVVGMIAHEHAHNFTAFEHFMPSGPLAFLPMQGHTSGFVWTTSPLEADRLMTLADELFSAALEDHIGPIFGKVHLIAPRVSYPLSVNLARDFYAERLALVGDAAHAIHPVAGQALNLGFRDVEVLLELITQEYNLGLDIGRTTLLRAYQQRRRFDTVLMTSVTDGLVRLFQNPSWIRRRMTQTGLAAFRHFSPLKRLSVRYALDGTVGR